MASYFGIDTSNSTDLQYLVDAYKKTRQPDLDKLSTKKTEMETSRTYWNKIQTNINAMLAAGDAFDSETGPSKFQAKKVSTSDNTTITATATGSSPIGTTLVKVTKLAEKDLLLSNTVDIDGKFNEIGNKVFSITSGDKTFDISVEFSGEEANSQAFLKIANAINEKEDINVIAAFVKNTSKTGILSLMANNTGEDYQVKITGSNDLLSKLGWNQLNTPKTQDGNTENEENSNSNNENKSNNRTIAKNGKAGYIYSDPTALNSKFNINGVDIERDSNTISDAIDGMTITLKKPSENLSQATVLETDIDIDSVKSFVQPLLDKYNTMIKMLYTDKTQRRADSTISTLYNNLRFISSEKITSVDEQKFTYLMSIGITVATDGTLKFTDDEKFYETLKESPDKVAQLFISSDGFKAKLDKILSDFEGEGNIIQSRTTSLTEQIKRQDDRYKSLEAQIEKEAQNLSNEYRAYIGNYYKAQQQLGYLQTMG